MISEVVLQPPRAHTYTHTRAHVQYKGDLTPEH